MGTHLRILFWLAAAASLTSTLLGCEARVSLGAQCEFAADCPSPMVCKMGRCRAECREARDCPFPLECMMENGVGGCRVIEDGACPRGTIDCADGLECVEGRCMQRCTDHSECAEAQRCDGLGCERNPVEGECDALSGAGCAGGLRCTPTGCVALIAGEVRDGELAEPCEDLANPCREGLTCVANRCLRWCEFERDAAGMPTTTPDSSCGEGSFCASADTTGGRAAPSGFGYCTQRCDPTTTGMEAGCLPDMNCGVAIPGTAYSSCEPRAATGGARWEACSEAKCAEGLDCVYSTFPEARCLAHCETDMDCLGNEHCALDLTHTIVDQNGVSRDIGVCLPACTSAMDCDSFVPALPGTLACTLDTCRGS